MRKEKTFFKKFGEERIVHYLCRPLPQKTGKEFFDLMMK